MSDPLERYLFYRAEVLRLLQEMAPKTWPIFDPPIVQIGELTEEAKAERRSPPITIWFGTGGEA